MEGGGACCPARRLNNDAVANPPQGPRHRKTRKPCRTAAPRKIISARRCKPDHTCVNVRRRNDHELRGDQLAVSFAVSSHALAPRQAEKIAPRTGLAGYE